METALYRYEVYYKITDSRGEVVRSTLRSMDYPVESVIIADNYLINHPLKEENLPRVGELLIQPVTQDFCVNEPCIPTDFDYAIEIGYLPGVTDNVAHTVRESIEHLLSEELDVEKSVFTTTTYFIKGNISDDQARGISLELHNPLIQRSKIMTASEYKNQNGMGMDIPVVDIRENVAADTISLNVDDEELMAIAREGIKGSDGNRRGPLALDMLSMNTIKNYYKSENREPTDIELESIAQTWSEHCKHTIFAAKIDDIEDGIFKSCIREATVRIRREKGENDFCMSVFTDNAGGIEFDENYIVSDKVETHNSPSALDPFGGSITGIVGVNRDSIGFGMGSKPIANRYGFCFADPFDKTPLYRSEDGDDTLLLPRRIMEGVIRGVNVGGNTSGIPTTQGFVYFDERYKGKPLVFVGTVGLIPKKSAGKSSVIKKAMPGDNVVIIGGRVGRDGIHGATFSSEALSSGSPATAVQIGDPITQKKLSDAIVKEARDMGLYNSITDNGAGGLSCSVAEMAREAGGFEVDLEKVPLKYPGLAPWQIWVSESQERMTLSVPDSSLEKFIDLMKRRGVEVSVIGRFTSSGRGIVCYKGEKIFDLDMGFLHDGLPIKELKTAPLKPATDRPEFDSPADLTRSFVDMTGRLNTSSFEFISTQYDHEVQAGSVVKPLQGRGAVNGSVSVVRPVLDSYRGVALSQGVYPSYSEIDPYKMAACSIDTAVRHIVSAGGSVDYLAILDNFCWCDSNNPERLGQLKQAALACYDVAVAYGTPYVSGKDSMFNDFRGYDCDRNPVMISIPPTLLISSIGVVEDVRLCQTLDFKCEGDLICIIGKTSDETGGSEYLAYAGETLRGSPYKGETPPSVDTSAFIKSYRSYEKAMKTELFASSIAIERGGLALAAAKSGMGGLLGFEIDLSKLPGDVLRNDFALFAETQGRFLVSIDPSRKGEFEKIFQDIPAAVIGRVTSGDVTVQGLEGNEVVNTNVDELLASYKECFKGF